MNKSLIAGPMLLLLGTGAAMAWGNVSGTITNLDKGKHQLTLNNGQVYALQANIKSDGLAVGDRVTLNTEPQDGVNVVNAVTRN